ncbi:Rv0909 family putative TA system antitoxin [Streptomyces sp. NPDC050564]|uniref:Rv0909 family putative TA system antitoxin n=1 Tax=Streptomyces sp. NPDC050564 TaxID=3365631 RepID=UPI003797B098
MGIFDRFKSHGQDKAKQMSDAAEQEVNEKSGNKYTGQVDDAQQKVEGATGMDRDRPEQQ